MSLAPTTWGETSQRTSARLPDQFEQYAANVVRFTADERRRLGAGAAVTKPLVVDETKEVGVFGAIWISAPIRSYIDVVNDIENFERGGGFRVTRRISVPPRLEDFAELRLPDEDIADLRTCRVGDCDVKLSEDSLERFRAEIDWRQPNARAAADALMRRLALEYVTGYLEGRNERLAVYRDRQRPTVVAQEFRAMVDRMPELTVYMPDMRRYLMDYPAESLPNATSFLYWQETSFGLKPTIRISHLTIREGADDTVVVSKTVAQLHAAPDTLIIGLPALTSARVAEVRGRVLYLRQDHYQTAENQRRYARMFSALPEKMGLELRSGPGWTVIQMGDLAHP